MLPCACRTCTSPFRLVCGARDWATAKADRPNRALASAFSFICLIALLFLRDGHGVRFLFIVGIHRLCAAHRGLLGNSMSKLILLQERVGSRQMVRDVAFGMHGFDDAFARVGR